MISFDSIRLGLRAASASCVVLLFANGLRADDSNSPSVEDRVNSAAALPRGGAHSKKSPDRALDFHALPRGSEATTLTDSSPLANDDLPLITPFNFDPADPSEYSRRAGVVSPGSVATGRTWNRPPPKVRLNKRPAAAMTSSTKPAANAASALPPASETEPIDPLVVPEESVSTAAHIIIAPGTASTRGAELLPAFAPQTRQLGNSVLGLPIVGHFFGATGPKTLIFAAIHGDESNTAFVASQLVEHLIKNPEAYYARRVAIVPVVNPDGLARGTRTNAREVDLNRNFPAKNFAVGKKGRYFGGEHPASEPESQLLIQLIDDWQPNRIITMHAITRGKHGNNFDGPAESLAKIMSRHNEYSVLKSMGYPTPGSFGSWAGIDHQLPTITLELPADATGPVAWRENREALLSAIHAK